MGSNNSVHELADQILRELSYIRTHTSKTAEQLSTGVFNNVLESRRYQFDDQGIVDLSWGTTCGAIEVTNHTAAPIYVQAGPRSGESTPGMQKVDAGLQRVINVFSRNVTLYGTADGDVGIQAVTRGGIVGNSITAVDGGAP